ncbi:MAG: low molecular weight phosphotyrosine protein phosphatase [Rhodobacteraceae bacterium]|nr:low molecular weight phosphotyrosine protein phosphatase [Paracoccaceae bacterium]
MFRKVLVVCVGNICRSPLGERLLHKHLEGTGIIVGSAGIAALEGHAADEDAAAVAEARGISLAGHVARQFTAEMGSAHDLILVMEPGHRTRLQQVAPQLSGRTMLFDHWTGGQGIADPYRRSRAFHESTFDLVARAAHAWAERLSR